MLLDILLIYKVIFVLNKIESDIQLMVIVIICIRTILNSS